MKNASNKRFYKGISSGGKQYVADGKPGQHSPFAGSFLNVLFNKAMNKSFVTADEIIGEIKSNPRLQQLFAKVISITAIRSVISFLN